MMLIIMSERPAVTRFTGVMSLINCPMADSAIDFNGGKVTTHERKSDLLVILLS